MGRNYKRKPNRVENYTKETMQQALEKIGVKLLQLGVLKTFSIPISTLMNQFEQKRKSDSFGRNTAIHEEAEKTLKGGLLTTEKWCWDFGLKKC